MPGNHEAEGGHGQPVVDALKGAFVAALLAGEDAAAERVVREAIDADLSEALINDYLIAPALRLIGELHAAGQLPLGSVGVATDISVRVLALERVAFRTANGRRFNRVLLAGIEGEEHVLGLEMAGSVLAHAGYDVRNLGAHVPLEALGPAVLRHRPAIVGFSVTMPATATLVPAAIAQVCRRDPRVGILIGGTGASDRMRVVPDLAICQHVSDVVNLADALVHRAVLN